jgi:curved DNA-binding protein CbpA
LAQEDKNRRNYYRILHVQPDAPIEIIRTSYRTLMHSLKMHPDLGGEPRNAALINEAFATLSNPARRAAYDKMLKQLRDHEPPVRKALPSPPEGEQEKNCPFCNKTYLAGSELPDSICDACQSPLFPAKEHEHSSATRRAFERVPRRMRVICTEAAPAHHQFEMTSDDLSITGMG